MAYCEICGSSLGLCVECQHEGTRLREEVAQQATTIADLNRDLKDERSYLHARIVENTSLQEQLAKAEEERAALDRWCQAEAERFYRAEKTAHPHSQLSVSFSSGLRQGFESVLWWMSGKSDSEWARKQQRWLAVELLVETERTIREILACPENMGGHCIDSLTALLTRTEAHGKKPTQEVPNAH